jgi:uncharacterized protein YkwD
VLGWGGRARGRLLGLAAALAVSGGTPNADGGPAGESVVQDSGPLEPARGAVGTCVAGKNWGIRRDDLAQQIVQLVNAHRVQIGQRPLRGSVALTRSARWKARHMARYLYFGHGDPAPPVTRSVPQRLAACGFERSGSENLAYGFTTAVSVVRAWLDSPGHRRNIELPNWTYMGVGAASSRSNGATFWVQNFG